MKTDAEKTEHKHGLRQKIPYRPMLETLTVL